MSYEGERDRCLKMWRKRNLGKSALLPGGFLLCVLNVTLTLGAQENAEIILPNQAEIPVNTLLWLGLLLFGCFLLAGKYVYTQVWRKNSISAKDARLLRKTRERLLHSLVELDEKYESGRFDPQVYSRERMRRKQQLVELMAVSKKS